MSSNSIARKVEKLFSERCSGVKMPSRTLTSVFALIQFPRPFFVKQRLHLLITFHVVVRRAPFALYLSLKWTNGRRHEKSKSIEEPYLRFIKHWIFHWRFPIKSNFHQSKTPTEFDFQMIYEWKASRIQNVYRFFNSKSERYETVSRLRLFAFEAELFRLSQSGRKGFTKARLNVDEHINVIPAK